MASPGNTKAVRDLFGSDADRYDARHYRSRHRTYIGDRQRLVARMLSSFGLPAGARVLDVACGPGHFLLTAKEAGFNVVGIDSSPDMLRTSGNRLGDGASLTRGDATMLPFESGSFDIVNCSGLIEYIPVPGGMLREFLRVLKPGGRAMVSSTNRIAPALALLPIMDALKRSSIVRRLIRALRLPVDEASLRDRGFDFTFHTSGGLVALMDEAGFEDIGMHYCHLQLLPHPLDHLVPAVTTACVNLTDRLLGVRPFGSLAEGLLAVGQRGAGPTVFASDSTSDDTCR
jgi:ubiquinone/menaquinone biosynthesis C-methylase UbiE